MELPWRSGKYSRLCTRFVFWGLLLTGLLLSPWQLFSQSTIFSDDFSTNKGWTLGTSWGRGSATVSVACGYGTDPSTDNTATSDNYILGYAIGACYANSLASTYYATSPVINCSGAAQVHIRFYRWLGVESSSYDHATLDVYNGSTWTTIYANAASFSDGSWTYLDYDVSAYAINVSNFQVRFGMGTTDGSVDGCGWNIDDFSVVVWCNAPSVPVLTGASAVTATSANLNWNASASGSPTLTYYWELYYDNGASGATLKASGNTTSTSVNVTGLTQSQKYYYRVYAKTSCDGSSSAWSGYSYFHTCSDLSVPAIPSIAPGTISSVGYAGFISSAKNNCTYYQFGNTPGVPELADMGMAGSGGGSLNYTDGFGVTHTGAGLTYTYNVSNVQCGTWYCLDLSANPLNGAAPAVGVSCNNTSNTPFTNSPLGTPTGVGTNTLTFTGSTLSHVYNSSGGEGTYTVETRVIVTATGAGNWLQSGSRYYLVVPSSGSFSVNVLALADAYDYNGHMTGSNFQQLGCPYEKCDEISASIATHPTWYGINYWFNSMHSLNNSYVNQTTWGKVYNAYNPVWVVNPLPSIPVSPAASPSAICLGSSSTLSATPGANGDQVKWYSGSCGGTLIGTGNQTVTPGAGSTTYYAITYNSVSGCYSSGCANATVTVYNPLSIGAISGASSSTQCAGYNPPAMSIGASGGVGTYAYQWQSSPAGCSAWSDIAGATSSSYDPPAINATTCFRVNVDATGSPDCGGWIASNVITYTISAFPIASAGPDIIICSGQTPISMTGASTGGTTSGYNWSGGGGLGTWNQGSGVSNATFTPSVASGSFTATLTVTGSGACSGSNPQSTRVITWSTPPTSPSLTTHTP